MTAIHKCRHCGCTEESPCTLRNGDACLLNQEKGVCNREDCLRLEEARQRTLAPATRGMYAGWGYGAIVDDLRRKRRKMRRGKGRAA